MHYSSMNLMFTPSALALFLSAANVVASSNIEHSDNAVVELTNHVNSSYQQKKSGGVVETEGDTESGKDTESIGDTESTDTKSAVVDTQSKNHRGEVVVEGMSDK